MYQSCYKLWRLKLSIPPQILNAENESISQRERKNDGN